MSHIPERYRGTADTFDEYGYSPMSSLRDYIEAVNEMPFGTQAEIDRWDSQRCSVDAYAEVALRAMVQTKEISTIPELRQQDFAPETAPQHVHTYYTALRQARAERAKKAGEQKQIDKNAGQGTEAA